MAAMDTPIEFDRGNSLWASDVVAATLRDLEIPYIALNPGSSYRGLHDSLVNYLGNQNPQILLCLHEETAAHIAHGYAKVSEKPLAVGVHANVGLLHGSMGIFNAYCERVPMLVMGATGPLDAAKRRPWIDWVHTWFDQADIVRGFIKYTDQPGSATAARWSLMHAYSRAMTAPAGPTYVVWDWALQEARLDEELPPFDVTRFAPPKPARPDPALVDEAAGILASAKRPLILMGRTSRKTADWDRRVALAERLNARVITDFKLSASFPTAHPRHVAQIGIVTHAAIEEVKNSDAILSLDWLDAGSLLRTAFGNDDAPAKIVKASVDLHNHTGMGQEHFSLYPADVNFLNETDFVVHALADKLGAGAPKFTPPAYEDVPEIDHDGPLTFDVVAQGFKRALGGRKVSMQRMPLLQGVGLWDFTGPFDYFGLDGGGGIGSGPGMSVGGALALRDMGSDLLPVSMLGDGDYIMGVNAIWTAVHYRIPLLFVIHNNRAFFNDVAHQGRVAEARSRPLENRYIGQAIADPDIRLGDLASAQGASGFGPIERAEELETAFREAIAIVENGGVAVVDCVTKDD
jgi:thiamine pyrophosphate-dependent acetolactate synthase large subunit-like protein